jgi:hypothetical protein
MAFIHKPVTDCRRMCIQGSNPRGVPEEPTQASVLCITVADSQAEDTHIHMLLGERVEHTEAVLQAEVTHEQWWLKTRLACNSQQRLPPAPSC